MKARARRFRGLGVADKDITFITFRTGDDRAGHGLVAAPHVGSGLQFLPVSVDPAVIGGRLFAAESGLDYVVRFAPNSGIGIERIRTARASKGAVSRSADGTHQIVLSRTKDVAIHLTNGQTTLLPADFSGVGVVNPTAGGKGRRIAEFTAPAPITRGDQWLLMELAHHRGMNDLWHAAVAAGTFARLARHKVPLDVGTAEAGHRWMASLTESARDIVCARAHARLDAMWTRVEALTGVAASRRESWWRDAFLQLCHERDEFESVWHLLSWRGLDDALRSRIDRFDTAARQLAWNVAFPPYSDDERLRRASLVNPTAWWVRGVEHGGLAR